MSVPATNKAPVPAPPQSNPVRLGILLGLLAIVVAMLVHHFAAAKPATDQAYDDIQKLFDERNAKGVVAAAGAVDARLVQPADVQDLLKKKPWSTVTLPDHVIETYWWYGMPHQNYVTVLYYKNGDKVKFNTHYKNGKPPAEDLPGAVVNDTKPTGEAPPPTTEQPATEKPTTETPAEEKPAETKSAEEKPAEKPAEATEKKEE